MNYRTLMIGWVLAALAPAVASAQQSQEAYRQGSWELGLGGGILLNHAALRTFLGSGPASSRFANTATPRSITPILVARVGYNFSSRFGAEVSGTAASGAGVRYLTPSAAIVYNVNLNARTTPFVFAGTELTRINGQNDRVTHSEWGFHGGLGLRHMLGEHMALRLEGALRIEHYDEPSMSRNAVLNPVITVGISHFLGGGRQAARIVTETRLRVDTVTRIRRDTVTRTVRETVVARQDEDTEQLVLRVQFETNRTTLLPRSLPVLDSIALAINATPDSRWEVEGHTDSIGSDADNRVLGQGRAQAVVDYLVSRGVNRGIMTAVSFGSDRAVFSNSTVYGRAQNRRVQLRRIPAPPVGPPVR